MKETITNDAEYELTKSILRRMRKMATEATIEETISRIILDAIIQSGTVMDDIVADYEKKKSQETAPGSEEEKTGQEAASPAPHPESGS